MSQEIWKKIDGYTNYSISSFGNVRNDKTDKLLKLSYARGYTRVGLSNNKKVKGFFVHRLVAFAFLGKPEENQTTIDHINRIKDDNKPSNLRWASHTEQNYNKIKTSHQPKKVMQFSLDDNYIKMFDSAKIAAENIKGCNISIKQACVGRLKTSGGFKWKFEENTIIQGEIWKEIKVENILFIVSNKGRIKHSHNTINYGYNYGGYKAVQKTLNGKTKTMVIHRLVAMAFIPNLDPLKNIVNHKDGNKTNNTDENLEWVTASENVQHSINILNNKVKPIIQRDADSLKILGEFKSIKNGAKKIGISYASIGNCLNGKQKSTCGFIFEY